MFNFERSIIDKTLWENYRLFFFKTYIYYSTEGMNELEEISNKYEWIHLFQCLILSYPVYSHLKYISCKKAT